MIEETLKSTGEIRRKVWLLDSTARETGSDGDGCLRQEDCVGRPCRPGSSSDEAGRCWRPEAVARQATCATPFEGASGSRREREMRAVLAMEHWRVRDCRRSDPRRRSRRHSASPLVSRDACPSSEGPGRGSGRGGVRVRDDPQTRNDQITLCGRKILWVEEMGGNFKHHKMTWNIAKSLYERAGADHCLIIHDIWLSLLSLTYIKRTPSVLKKPDV
jgi:hypothetical protein